MSRAHECFGASESFVFTSKLDVGHLKMLALFLLGRQLNKRIDDEAKSKK